MKHSIVLYVPWVFDLLGGVDVVVDRLRIGLKEDGHFRPLIGVQDWSSPSGVYQDSDGREFLPVSLPAWPEINTPLTWLRFGISVLRRSVQLQRQLRRENVAVFNAHFPTTGLFIPSLLRKFGLWSGKLILSFHGSDVKTIDSQKWVWRFIASQTRIVVVCSAFLAEDVKRLGIFNGDSIKVVSNGIDVDAFRAKARLGDWSAITSTKYVVNVGNFVPGKSQDKLISAFAKVAEQFEDLRLVLAGGKDNGSWLARLREQVESLNLQHKVVFLADVPHDQVPSLIGGAAVFAHTASSESFGLVLIEAGAMGTPIVAASVGGVPEVLGGDGGVLYQYGDVEQLAVDIASLLADEIQAAEMASKMSARVEERFSLGGMILSYLLYYR